jgi:fructosamine-3-kinase
MHEQASRAAALLGQGVDTISRLHGGDLSEIWRLELSGGGTAVLKTGATARAEAAMLRAIRQAGAPAPEVLAVEDGLLLLKDLGTAEGPGRAWADLGAVLQRLHGTRGSSYGWPEDHAFGPVGIPNAACADWPSFWAERRLLPSCAHIAADLALRVEALAARLPGLVPAHPAPVLLHGDLWGGNILVRDGRIIGLIDPACYHGHAEVDLAMLTLFDRPAPEFHDSYGPPEPGWQDRRPVYQLWPALVHLRLFGPGYRGMVERCLSALGG